MADEGDAEVSDAQLSAEITARDTEVSGLLAKKDKLNALKVCLRTPPVLSKSEEVKVYSSYASYDFRSHEVYHLGRHRSQMLQLSKRCSLQSPIVRYRRLFRASPRRHAMCSWNTYIDQWATRPTALWCLSYIASWRRKLGSGASSERWLSEKRCKTVVMKQPLAQYGISYCYYLLLLNNLI